MGLSATLALTGCADNNAGSSESRPVNVKVMTVTASPMLSSTNYSGTIEESSGTSLSFSAAGTVKSLNIQIGQYVSKGTVIATLDDANAHSAYEMAQSSLNQAEDAYQRMKLLHDNNSLPEIEWIKVQTQLQQAKSAFDIAAKNLNDCKLLAPASGVISQKNIEIGQNVIPGMSVAKLSSIATVKVNVSVPENEIATIGNNQEIAITVPALGNRAFTGRVTEKGVEANPMSRTYMVKATVQNPQSVLMPGMICDVAFHEAEMTSAVIIPANCVQISGGESQFVWVNDNGKASKRNITVGEQTANGVVVTSGLSNGDNLIVEGQQKVSEGMLVNVIK